MTYRTALRAMFALTLGLFLSAAAHAQLFRTYVAPDGNDANPCTLAAPCRLLPAAIAAVINGGEIWMLGSANYNTGPVNINKAVTILAVPGALGSVVAIGGNAINIGTAGVKVALRNLVIVPFVGGGGVNGIVMTAGASLTVENCLIANLPGAGILVYGGINVLVTDTTIRGNAEGLNVQNGVRATITRATITGNGASGVFITGSVAGSTTIADITDSTVSTNVNGVYAYSSSAAVSLKVSVRNSQVVGNAAAGLFAQPLNGFARVSATNNIISNNDIGIRSEGPGARVLASGNTLTGNDAALSNGGAGSVLESAGDNVVRQNSFDFVGTIAGIVKM